MRVTPSLLRRTLASVALPFGALACADLATQPGAVRPGALRHDLVEVTAGLLAAPTLLACPTAEAASARAVIGPEGGTITARGASITIPAGAVPDSTLFEVVVPVSPFLETDIRAIGAEHYVFQTPVTITINYARCPSNAIPIDAALQGVYVDTDTYQVLQLMGGVNDRLNHKVSFATPHLSGYIVAY